MRKLTELAERCEQAVFPCRDDASASEIVAIKSAICRLVTGRGYDAYSPDYTGSLDAAMTLVPEGWVYSGHEHLNGAHTWDLNDRNSARVEVAEAATPALALCAAALRARTQNTPG